MLAKTPARELMEIEAEYKLEPWGESRTDLNTGILASLVANLMRGKHGKQFKPKDFMPQFEPQEKKTSGVSGFLSWIKANAKRSKK